MLDGLVNNVIIPSGLLGDILQIVGRCAKCRVHAVYIIVDNLLISSRILLPRGVLILIKVVFMPDFFLGPVCVNDNLVRDFQVLLH